MGTELKKRGAKWYVYVTHNSVRTAKCLGTRQAAEEVRRQLEARFALGDTTFLSDGGKPVPTFEQYAGGWLETYAEIEYKPSTKRSYEQLLRLHVTPRFGNRSSQKLDTNRSNNFYPSSRRQPKKSTMS